MKYFIKAFGSSWLIVLFKLRASLVAQMVKSLLVMQETRVRSLGWEDPLGKEMATHSSILAWKIPWTEEPGRLQSMELQRYLYADFLVQNRSVKISPTIIVDLSISVNFCFIHLGTFFIVACTF